MKIEKKFTIIGLSIIVIIFSMIIGISFALPEDIISSEYIIKNNTIYAVPTTYNFRVEELLSKINSSNELSVYNTNNELLVNGNKVSNGYTLKSGDSTYNIVVLGDVTDDGTINLGDVSKLYNAYIGKTNLNSNGIKSGDTTNDQKIDLGDVSKLYNYFKGNSPFSYFDDNMIDVDNLVDKANSYYESNTNSNLLGTNLINELQIDNNFNDQVVITRNGEVEMAIKKQDKCYRKSALNDYINVVDEEYCNVDVTKFASNNGRLHVEGSKLMNSKGEEFRLMGTSNAISPNSSYSSCLRQADKMYSKKSMSVLNNWGANGFRMFVGKSFWDTEAEEYSLRLVDLYNAIDNIIANDLYVILNWNSASDDPDISRTAAAKKTFSDIVNHYGNDYHIIYEIWNEPYATTWEPIKNHADELIPMIRAKAPDSLILVGTPSLDSRPDLVIGNELSYKNIMYTHHTYSGSVNSERLGYLQKAIDAGLPMFESECSGAPAEMIREDYYNPAQSRALITMLNKYNISYMYFCWETGYWAYNFISIYKYKTWDENVPDSQLNQVAFQFKRWLKGDYSTESYLMTENTQEDGVYYKDNKYREKIVSVTFNNKLDVPKNTVAKWDLSFNQDNSVIGYLVNSSEEGMYDLVIAANGYINLSKYPRKMFKGLSKVKSYDLRYVKTEMADNFSSMFEGNSSLESIDLSTFDASRVRFMTGMFYRCTSLKTVKFTNWSAPKLLNIGNMFGSCNSLTSLDLSMFDVSKVYDFRNIFNGDKNLTNLNISTWKPNNVKYIDTMFSEVENLSTIDLSGFTTFEEGYTYENVFKNVPSTTTIKTGNSSFKTTMQTTYPSLNFE